MEKIFSLLQEFRLERYYSAFIEIGVKDERDFIDSIDDEDLTTLSFSHVEKKKFGKMKARIEKLGCMVTKSMEEFRLKYRFPKCSEAKELSNIDPSQNTLEDLMIRIGFGEQIGNDKAVCLYTMDGMPLTDDPFFNTWSLKDRHIENGSELYAIFTCKENLRNPPGNPKMETSEILGDDTGDYEIQVDLEKDTLKDLRQRLSIESGIPAHVLHVRDEDGGYGESLKNLEIDSQSVVHFSLSSFESTYMTDAEFFMNDITPSVQQTRKGMSVFLSTFYIIYKSDSGVKLQKVIAYIRKLTGCNALAQALHQLVSRGVFGTRNQKIAIVEGLYLLFRELLPSLAKRTGPHIIEDVEVFEYSNVCWAYLMSQSKDEKSEFYATISLNCAGTGKHLCDPVRIPGMHTVFDRAYVLDKIKGGQKIPGCSEERLKETSIQRATDIERILLSLPLSSSFSVWISCGSNCNFQVNAEQTFDEMSAGLSMYPHLQPTPPLQILDLGLSGPGLLYTREDNLCVYHSRIKQNTDAATVHDFLSGKPKEVNIRSLAQQLGDFRRNQDIRVDRVPKEAILVLVDASSSMKRQLYPSWTRMDAVKQLFHSFADRTMAYDFPHVIGLIKVGKDVKFHKFTESLETFRTYVHNLETQFGTPLYDALNQGLAELQNIKTCFPKCRLRILCLTDGADNGSCSDPVQVAVKLIEANIVVDSVLLRNTTNTILHGISNATGGCCFRPVTSKGALKLFEMETVLSLERRKLKKKSEVSSIRTLADLTNIFTSRGFDDKPEVAHPEELGHKVILPQNALRKKIQQSTSGRFIDRDRRIMEELKHLHIDPHPYCTVLPSETDFKFWKILMRGPPDTSYAQGSFELYCQFGADYPLKPPLVRFLTPIYHCNVNSVGRICHNIFDRDYSAHVTMREILDAIFGLLIAPEGEDPLDSVLAEEFLSSRDKYEEEATNATAQEAATSIEDLEKKLVVTTKYGHVYERAAIEKALNKNKTDPFSNKPLDLMDLKPNREMKKLVRKYRESQIQETAV
ncbi:hypothetical protein GJAV_G00123070 [Gymnothorax javanicus]|nr:hypothetical protein GJAV_G00123070 [Gymnothorax javanicus]